MSASSIQRLENNISLVAAAPGPQTKARRCYNPLDSLSERTQTVCLIICAGIFIGCNLIIIMISPNNYKISVICIIIQALNNPICIHKKSQKENSLNSNKKVIIKNFHDLTIYSRSFNF